MSWQGQIEEAKPFDKTHRHGTGGKSHNSTSRQRIFKPLLEFLVIRLNFKFLKLLTEATTYGVKMAKIALIECVKILKLELIWCFFFQSYTSVNNTDLYLSYNF